MPNLNDKSKNTGAANAVKYVDDALYNALRAVFLDGAYCAQAITKSLKGLNNLRAHPFVTSAFYGVLDNNVRLETVINGLCDKQPDKNSAVVLKIGLFYCNYADMPSYAAVNRAVDLAKRVGVFSGFVNAVLKRSIGYTPVFKTDLQKFCYDCNAPEWLCRELIKDYGDERAASILKAELPKKTHIRPVLKKISWDEFRSAAKGSDFTEYGCYCDRATMDNFAPGSVVVQSVSSVRAVRAYIKGLNGGDAVDLCAAPGGKSVYISECGDFKVTACDIYPHKLDLIRGYAKKHGAKIDVALNDATKLRKEFIGGFDLVVADCPCSGTGTLRSKPDILLNRKNEDIDGLCELQRSILSNAAMYCKPGGVLCYSTCSVLKRENENICAEFLSAHPEYTDLDETKLLPDSDGCDGFYIRRFKRTETV